jgi:hypothetical protein
MLNIVFEVSIEMISRDVSRLLLRNRVLYFIEIINNINNNDECTQQVLFDSLRLLTLEGLESYN